MLDEESIQAYKNIRLTKDLRADILTRHASQHASAGKPITSRLLRPLGAVCSLVLIAAVVFTMASHTRTGVYTSGQRIDAAPRTAATESVSFTDTRTRVHLFDLSGTDDLLATATDCVPLRMHFGKDVFVEVEDGMLLVPDEGGNYLPAGFFGVLSDGDTLYWSLMSCESLSPLTATITDTDENVLARVTLTYDTTDCVWQIAGDLSEK